MNTVKTGGKTWGKKAFETQNDSQSSYLGIPETPWLWFQTTQGLESN